MLKSFLTASTRLSPQILREWVRLNVGISTDLPGSFQRLPFGRCRRSILPEVFVAMSQSEVYRPAFADPPGTTVAGLSTKNLRLSSPHVSYGLPYQEACARHVHTTYKASRVYIVASGTLSRESNRVDTLVKAIGKDKVAGVRQGMTPHTPYSEILQITAAAKEANSDCLVTLGAGSITDGAKMVALVSLTLSIRLGARLMQSTVPRQRHQVES
jgi:hypothetical protein